MGRVDAVVTGVTAAGSSVLAVPVVWEARAGPVVLAATARPEPMQRMQANPVGPAVAVETVVAVVWGALAVMPARPAHCC